MQTFQVGKTYTTRSICDHDCVIKVEVASRTAKTIKTPAGKTFRVDVHDGAEFIRLGGAYSMAPIVRANDNQL